jgi:hypothetical protein
MGKLTVQIVETTLSDGSTACDVAVTFRVPAITHADADELAAKLKAAIEQHTNEEVIIRECLVQP